jgi:hypothetical protein
MAWIHPLIGRVQCNTYPGQQKPDTRYLETMAGIGAMDASHLGLL